MGFLIVSKESAIKRIINQDSIDNLIVYHIDINRGFFFRTARNNKKMKKCYVELKNIRSISLGYLISASMFSNQWMSRQLNFVQ